MVTATDRKAASAAAAHPPAASSGGGAPSSSFGKRKLLPDLADAADALGPAEITAEDVDGVNNEGGIGTLGADAAGGAIGAGAAKLPPEDDAAVGGPGVAGATAAASLPLAPPLLGTTMMTAAMFGISESALMAPVPPPPRKKRKKQDEFTIEQKLQILGELKGPGSLSVPDLAAKHNTSRTSVYRWKKDMPRLLKLAKKEGKGSYKRVSHAAKESEAEGKKRAPHNEEFTAAEKLEVVRQLGGEGAPSVREMAEKIGANHRSIYRWKKDEARLIKIVEQEGKGESKRVGDDPLHRLKEGLKLFHANLTSNAGAAGGEKQQQAKVNGTMIAAKARQIRDEMLAQHERTPFLTDEEVKGMKEFTASSSWGRKIVQRYGWKESGGGSDANNNDAAGAEGSANPVAGLAQGLGGAPKVPAKPAAPAAAPAAAVTVGKVEVKVKPRTRKQKPEQSPAELKREAAQLRKKLQAAEARASKLARENARLKGRLAEALGVNAGGEQDATAAGAPALPGFVSVGATDPSAAAMVGDAPVLDTFGEV